jgi:CRISPR-associated endonuclease Csn1
MLNPSVARTLAEREDMRNASRDTTGGTDKSWKDYQGSSEAAQTKYRKWLTDMDKLVDLVRAEIDADGIPVVSPVRYSAKHAKLHEDGRVAHATKRLGEAWTASERALIVDDRVYTDLSQGIAPDANLPVDESRTLKLPSGKMLDATGIVYLFPDTAARIALPGHSLSKLGQSIHHARVYRWDDAKGRRQAGVVRMWASDLYDLYGGIDGDVLTEPLKPESRAARRADMKVRQALETGKAELVGYIMPGDELVIDVADYVGDSDFPKFLSNWPEAHWRVAGLMSNNRMTINPYYLSGEGIQTTVDAEPNPALVPVTAMEAKVISDRIPFSYSSLWGKKGNTIVRRTASGQVRIGTRSGLPSSWSPYLAVYGDGSEQGE